MLGVRAVRSLLFRQILNSISRSECKNGPIKGSATHAMRSCACAMFRPMAHPASDDAPAGGPISNVASCRAVDRRTVLHGIRRERLGVHLLPLRGYKQRVGQAWARRTRGCLRFRSRTCRSRMQRAVQHKAHTHASLCCNRVKRGPHNKPSHTGTGPARMMSLELFTSTPRPCCWDCADTRRHLRRD